jgi:hypothetical protein
LQKQVQNLGFAAGLLWVTGQALWLCWTWCLRPQLHQEVMQLLLLPALPLHQQQLQQLQLLLRLQAALLPMLALQQQ